MVSKRGGGKGTNASGKGDLKDADRGAGKDSKGSKSRTKGLGKSKGSAIKTSREGTTISRAKTLQEVEAEMLTAAVAPSGVPESGRRDAAKLSLQAKGDHCEVRKHSDMGCAVVTIKSEPAREAVIKMAELKATSSTEKGRESRPQIVINGFAVQMRRHFDKVLEQEVKTDIFIAWGRQAEKQSPLSAATIAEAFDKLVVEAHPAGAQVPLTTAAQSGQQQVAPSAFLQLVGIATGSTVQAHAQPRQLASAVPSVPLEKKGSPAGPEIPPRQANSSNELRADAPTFMYTPTDPSSCTASFIPQNAEVEQYGNLYFPSAFPERKPFKIVNPNSGEPIEAPKLLPEFEPHMPGQKKMTIIDPNSGNAVDTLGLNFSPPKPSQPLTIIDPSSGLSITA